jgi:hypothetical protein
MSFASDTGYIPISIDQMMDIIRENVNTQFSTTYTADTFLGTNFYKYFYALIQRLQENEVKTSEIFLRMQEYFDITNAMIQRPNTTHPGIQDYFSAEGYFVSTKPPLDEDAGKLYICVDLTDNHARGKVTITSFANLISGTDDSVTVGATAFTAQSGAATPGAATFQAATSNSATATSLASQINAHATAGAVVEALAIDEVVWLRAVTGGTSGNSIALSYTDNDTNVGATVTGSALTGGRALEEDESDYDVTREVLCNLVKDVCVGGVVSQGSEVTSITLSNGQSFDFKYNLPTHIPVFLRLTLTLSENNEFTILSPDEIKELLLTNLTAKYRLGKNFEPQRYFSVVDAPWASTVLLEWTDDVTDGELDETPTWHDEVYEAEYDEVFTYSSSTILLVEE